MVHEWVDFRAVKATVNLVEVLRGYGVHWLRSRRPGQLQGRCPIHRGRREDAFHVSLSKNAFQCFACQAHGNVLDFVAAMERCTIREAALLLARRFSVCDERRDGGSLAAIAGREKPNWLGKNERFNQPLAFKLRGIDSSHPCLQTRGIIPETAARFGVGFYSGPGLMSQRLVIPIHNARGQLVAYAGRAVDGTIPKYRLPAGFVKSQVLFNFHRAARLDQEMVIVVEGYFDCLKVHQAGYPCVVGLMGTVLSATNEAFLLERFRRMLLMLDGDDSGRQAASRISAQLAGKCSVQMVAIPTGGQPDQLNRAEITALLEGTLGSEATNA